MREYIPVSTTRVYDIRIYYLFYHFWLSHFLSIFVFENDKLKSPKTIGWRPETSADGRPVRIAQKAEIDGEEKVVYFFRCISQGPEWKLRMRFFRRQ